MENINQNITRIGNFTSSRIGELMTEGKTKGSLGKPALTYIEEKNIERITQTPINKDSDFFNSAWGNLCEAYVYKELLGIDYEIKSKDTLLHTKYNYWSGSPDMISKRNKHVADIKCPTTLKSFYQLVYHTARGESGEQAIEFIRDGHSSGETYFWQLVSNAILTDANMAELIVFMPKEERLNAIREFADGIPEFDKIRFKHNNELPHMKSATNLKELYVITFEVTEEMKRQLTERVIQASELLLTEEQIKNLF